MTCHRCQALLLLLDLLEFVDGWQLLLVHLAHKSLLGQEKPVLLDLLGVRLLRLYMAVHDVL